MAIQLLVHKLQLQLHRPIAYNLEFEKDITIIRGVNLVQNVGTSCAGTLGDRSPPVGSRDDTPVGGLGDVPQKLKQF